MGLTDNIKFGKYKGKNAIAVWKGEYELISKDMLNDFVQNSIAYFFGQCGYYERILSTGSDLNKEDLKLIKELFYDQNDESFDSIIVNDGVIILDKLPEKIRRPFRNLLVKHFNSNYFSQAHFSGLKHPENENTNSILFTNESQNIVDLLPDPDYIEWTKREGIDIGLNENEYIELRLMNSVYPIIVMSESAGDNLKYNLYAYIQKHRNKPI